MKTYHNAFLAVALFSALTCCAAKMQIEPKTRFYNSVSNRAQLDSLFRFRNDASVVISGHRGGMDTGYPENCIESFEHTLSMMPSFFEIDPRLTKDSVIVLMHDKKIDRTTTGKGEIGSLTFDELRKLSLVDRNGNITNFKIPTLDECIEWSQGKCVLNLDIKDVPIEMMARFIVDRKPANVIYTIWNADQMLQFCGLDPNATFSIWCRNKKEFDDYVAKDIDWNRVKVAYVGPTMKPELHWMYDRLHEKGIKCMISVAPSHDKCYNDSCKIEGYRLELNTGMRPDIIETDYPSLFRNLRP